MASANKPVLGVGMAGYAFMGTAHSQAWRTAPRVYDLPLSPRMVALCGRDHAAASEAAARLGWDGVEPDVEALIARDDVDLLDICTPGDTHADLAVAALKAGKHVLCEKPLANTVGEAELMVEAAAKAAASGVRSMVGFTYRRIPAMALARRLIQAGRLGEVHHVRAQYLQDWIVDPEFPLVWRLQRAKAGSGALGDIGAHIVDLTQYLTGRQIESVSGLTRTFIERRPLPGAASGLSASGGEGTGVVDVDDAALFLARLSGGAVGSYEATRFATGRKNAIRIEVNGSKGSLAFDFESMNELSFHDATIDPDEGGFRRILVTEPTHPYLSAWWPAGHLIGYEHLFTHQVKDLVEALASDQDPVPSFADGLQVQRVLAAVEASAASGCWANV